MAKNGGAAGMAACLGAIVGAGFASGREVVAFFTRYGVHARWLIPLSAMTLALLCALCMDVARRRGTDRWWDLYEGMPPWVRIGARLCAAMMLAVTGGAMISASGWLAMLLWASEWAYPIGAVGTLLTAWMVGRRGLRALGWISGLLMAALVAALLAVRMDGSAASAALLSPEPESLFRAAGRAVAYASMNLALAIGVVCRCAQGTARRTAFLCSGLGVTLAALLMLSDSVYRGSRACWARRSPSCGCWRSLDGPAFSSARGCCSWRCLRRWRRCCAHWTGRRRDAADPCVPH